MNAIDIKYGLINNGLCVNLKEAGDMYRLVFKAILNLLKYGKNNRKYNVRIEDFGTFQFLKGKLVWFKKHSRENETLAFDNNDVIIEMEKLFLIKDNLEIQVNEQVIAYISGQINNLVPNDDFLSISGFGYFYVKITKEKIQERNGKTKIIPEKRELVFEADAQANQFLFHNSDFDDWFDHPFEPLEPNLEIFQNVKVKVQTPTNKVTVEIYPKELIDPNDPLNEPLETAIGFLRRSKFLIEENKKLTVFYFKTPVTRAYALKLIVKPKRFINLGLNLKELS